MKQDLANAFAKLAGVRKALQSVIDRAYSREGRPTQNFEADDVEHYFEGTSNQVHILRAELRDLFWDFKEIEATPKVEMSNGSDRYGLHQLEGLARDIDQIFEIRANSELATPIASPASPQVFISHGRAKDWMEVQQYIERDVGLDTLELALEPNLGRTVLQKLEEESAKCTSAVIVVTGDDIDDEGNLRARENVMHEIGYLQAKFGLSAACLLYQEGTNIPSNIQGLVYIPFPAGYISATFGALSRELKAFYNI